MNRFVAVFLAIAYASSMHVSAFSVPSTSDPSTQTSDRMILSRRELVQGLGFAAILATTPAVADTGAEVRGTPVTPFNGLIFNYRGNDFGGLKASDIDEPSIPYQEFVQRLKAGEVEFVEFLAPNGDAAYATIKGKSGAIRVGEGYPIEQPGGWSSPAFVIRTVQNEGVPYKFTVPALRASKK